MRRSWGSCMWSTESTPMQPSSWSHTRPPPGSTPTLQRCASRGADCSQLCSSSGSRISLSSFDTVRPSAKHATLCLSQVSRSTEGYTTRRSHSFWQPTPHHWWACPGRGEPHPVIYTFSCHKPRRLRRARSYCMVECTYSYIACTHAPWTPVISSRIEGRWHAQVSRLRVDRTLVVHLPRKVANLPLVKDYLLRV